jgi:transposase-like protein
LGALSIDRSASVRLAGLFRLPFTYNTKTGRRNSAHIRNHNRYDLRKMLDRYVPAEYNPHKSQKPRHWAAAEESSVVPVQEYVPLADLDAEVLKGGKTAMARRVQQLVRLRALRNAPMGQEMRDRFCFTVYCALLADYEQEEAWNRLLAFNLGFKQPLPYPALKQMMSSASEKKYRLTNEWIIGELEITEEEQQNIGLSRASETRSERMSRNYTRDLIRNSLRENRDKLIVSLFSQGKNKSEIARELGISWGTVAKVIQNATEIAPQEPEMDVAEPMAAGAEYQNVSDDYQNVSVDYQSVSFARKKTDSSKSVRNNIVSYGEATTRKNLYTGGGQAVRNKDEPPDN